MSSTAARQSIEVKINRVNNNFNVKHIYTLKLRYHEKLFQYDNKHTNIFEKKQSITMIFLLKIRVIQNVTSHDN